MMKTMGLLGCDVLIFLNHLHTAQQPMRQRYVVLWNAFNISNVVIVVLYVFFLFCFAVLFLYLQWYIICWINKNHFSGLEVS